MNVWVGHIPWNVNSFPSSEAGRVRTKVGETEARRLVVGGQGTGEIAGDGKDKFPIKLKDEALQASIKFLIKIGVFPDKDSDSDEMIFGDDDFPS